MTTNNLKLRNMTAIYLMYEGKVLLLYRQGGRVVNNVWVASAGGHFEEYELNDARACVLRELQEELNITEDMLCGLQLKYIAMRRTNGEIRQNYYFFANLKAKPEKELSSDEGILKWFSFDELSGLEMPLTAKYITEHYFSVGIHDDKIYIGTTIPEKIIFAQLPES